MINDLIVSSENIAGRFMYMINNGLYQWRMY